MNANAKDIYQTDVVTIQKHESLSQAARKMRDSHVGALVVVQSENGKTIPTGLITDRDILTRVLAKGASSTETFSVEDVMTRELKTCREEDSISDVITTMNSHGVRRIPIVDKNKNLKGIISLDDVLKKLAKDLKSQELEKVSAIIDKEKENESAIARLGSVEPGTPVAATSQSTNFEPKPSGFDIKQKETERQKDDARKSAPDAGRIF